MGRGLREDAGGCGLPPPGEATAYPGGRFVGLGFQKAHFPFLSSTLILQTSLPSVVLFHMVGVLFLLIYFCWWFFSTFYFVFEYSRLTGFRSGSAVKKPPARQDDIGDVGWIPGLGRSPGGGHGNPLQYSCLENPMVLGDWTTVLRVAARLKDAVGQD